MNRSDFEKQWPNLAQPELGAEVIYATDDFFAPKERLINPDAPVFIPDKFDDHGKWMDGWESRRKRVEGYDYCIIRLAYPGIIHGLNIDTSHFTGNFPPAASVDVCYSDTTPDENTPWEKLLPTRTLNGNSHNLFATENCEACNYIRLNIYPDGGVARLRVYGEIVPDPYAESDPETIDLIALQNGGRGLMCNDEHFGSMHNIIKPNPGISMGDGWETRRRREPGYDWAIFSLGQIGTVEKIIVDTAFFKGNYPDRCSIQASLVKGGNLDSLSTQSQFWSEILPQSSLSADNEHSFVSEVIDLGPISHVRLNLFPDGGVSRLRLMGKRLS